MILTNITDLTVYRMMVPKWSVAPTSGAGAARHGGRANRPGIEALYVALEAQTAVREYQQVSSLLPPGLLVSFSVTVDAVVDFRHGYNADDWDPIWQDFYCEWRELWFGQHIEPPSWAIGDTVLEAGAKGIIFPSRLVAGGTNLVLYPMAFVPSDRLSVNDPHHALPKNQDSWR